MKIARLVDNRFKTSLNKLTAQAMPLKTAFKLKGIAKRVQEELAMYEDVRTAALTKHGKKNEDGTLAVLDNGNVILEEDSRETFMEELNELLNSDVDVGCITINDLGDKVNLSADELAALGELISE